MIKSKNTSFQSQAKILRVFELIARLEAERYTLKQLASLYDMSERTIYRYIKLLEELNICIDLDQHNKYFIANLENSPKQKFFSNEETALIKTLVETGAGKNPLKDSLLQKLSIHSESSHSIKLYVKSRLTKLAEALAFAIKQKEQVILENYHSANSSAISNRLIEPFSFGTNFETIHALDLADKKCKFFKLERSSHIANTGKPWKYEHLHKENNEDVFGISGEIEVWVTLKLGLRSYLLLTEEFPMSLSYITQDQDETGQKSFVLNAPVNGFQGVTRFVMGLCDDIQIVAPKSFKAEIEGKLKQAKLLIRKK